MTTLTFQLVLPANEDRRIEAEDGTVYYCTENSVYTIYEDAAVARGGHLEVDLPHEWEYCGSRGRSLYFCSKEGPESTDDEDEGGDEKEKGEEMRVLYRVTADEAQRRIKMQRVNQVAISDDIEIFPVQPYYAIKKGNKLRVFRFEENAGNSEGVEYDITGSEGTLAGYRLIHKGKLILTQNSSDAQLCHVSNSVMLMRMPQRVMDIYLRDDSPFIYLLRHSKKEIVVINTNTLAVEKLKAVYDPAPVKSLALDFAKTDIVSVREGVFTYTTGDYEETGTTYPRQLWTAKLPENLV